MLGRLGQFDGVAANAIILPLWYKQTDETDGRDAAVTLYTLSKISCRQY